MKTVDLYLYRHGNTFNSGDKVVQVGLKTDLPLTLQGQEQAHAFGHLLNKNFIEPANIYCGQLKRQTESAAILHTYLPSSIVNEQSHALNEIDYGNWEGLTVEEIQARSPKSYEDWNKKAAWPSNIFNHSLRHHLDDLSSLLQTVYDTHDDQQAAVIVSSNGIIRLFLYFSSVWEMITQKGTMNSYKVKTGHFCKLELNSPQSLKLISWDNNPSIL